MRWMTGPVRCCSPRHRMPCTSVKQGSTCVSMTWRAMSARPSPLDLLPTWRLPEQFLRVVSPRQKSAQDAVTVIREVTTKLVDDCKVGTS
jgi:hypothetical protein